jgi:hypothetical protein
MPFRPIADAPKPSSNGLPMKLPSQDYKSPSRSRLVAGVENGLLAPDDSWWTGRNPLRTRVVADVPLALYLNYIVRKSWVAEFSPLFLPLEIPGDENATLFTILIFALEHARPVWAPRISGALAPHIMQSNWRFYGEIRDSVSRSRRGVLFVRTVTTSLLLSIFGRRLARCFPLRRARSMSLECTTKGATAAVEPGAGSTPQLFFDGERIESADVPHDVRHRFATYDEYARWIVDQHLSIVIWPREHVVQDMHLDFQDSKITPVRCSGCRVSDQQFVQEGGKPLDRFTVENLKVFLDNVYAVRQPGENPGDSE